eukprot:301302_1
MMAVTGVNENNIVQSMIALGYDQKTITKALSSDKHQIHDIIQQINNNTSTQRQSIIDNIVNCNIINCTQNEFLEYVVTKIKQLCNEYRYYPTDSQLTETKNVIKLSNITADRWLHIGQSDSIIEMLKIELTAINTMVNIQTTMKKKNVSNLVSMFENVSQKDYKQKSKKQNEKTDNNRIIYCQTLEPNSYKKISKYFRATTADGDVDGYQSENWKGKIVKLIAYNRENSRGQLDKKWIVSGWNDIEHKYDITRVDAHYLEHDYFVQDICYVLYHEIRQYIINSQRLTYDYMSNIYLSQLLSYKTDKNVSSIAEFVLQRIRNEFNIVQSYNPFAYMSFEDFSTFIYDVMKCDNIQVANKMINQKQFVLAYDYKNKCSESYRKISDTYSDPASDWIDPIFWHNKIVFIVDKCPYMSNRYVVRTWNYQRIINDRLPDKYLQ